MIYHVTARFNEDTAAEFLTRLTDGSIAGQRPDGREIVASMARAVVRLDGVVEWSEMCFCPSPLAHERSTVLDRHFRAITTEPIDAYTQYDGVPFMDHLRVSAQT